MFGGIALIGFLLSFGIRGEKLEDGDWEEGDDDGEANNGSDEEDGHPFSGTNRKP